jgi:hypothetical protein
MHHHCDRILVHKPRTGPDPLERHPIIHIENEMPSRPQRSRDRREHAPQIALSRHVIERVELARDHVHRFRQPEVAHVRPQNAHRQPRQPRLVPGDPAHLLREIDGKCVQSSFGELHRQRPRPAAQIAR